MPQSLAFLLPLALLAQGAGVDQARQLTPPTGNVQPTNMSALPKSVKPLDAAQRPSVIGQVRIERRVVIRIAPRSQMRRSSAAPTPRRNSSRQLVERKIGKCIKVSGIAAVQPAGGSKLMLYMRDKRLISATLEKACRASDFYSGFYVERSSDGNLCIQRDKLQSRTGVTCRMSKIRQLVAVDT